MAGELAPHGLPEDQVDEPLPGLAAKVLLRLRRVDATKVDPVMSVGDVDDRQRVATKDGTDFASERGRRGGDGHFLAIVNQVGPSSSTCHTCPLSTSKAVRRPPKPQPVSTHARWPRFSSAPSVWRVWPTTTVFPEQRGPGGGSIGSQKAVWRSCSEKQAVRGVVGVDEEVAVGLMAEPGALEKRPMLLRKGPVSPAGSRSHQPGIPANGDVHGQIFGAVPGIEENRRVVCEQRNQSLTVPLLFVARLPRNTFPNKCGPTQ